MNIDDIKQLYTLFSSNKKGHDVFPIKDFHTGKLTISQEQATSDDLSKPDKT